MEENRESILTGILAISGKPGLFKSISQGGTRLIVESLTDGKRNVATATNQVISLADVAMYGEDDEKPLEEIFRTMYKMENKAKASVSPKDSNNELNDYFEDVFPEFDKDRVYPSDIKKVIRWYNILLEKGMIDFDELDKATPTPEAKEEAE